MKRFFLPVLLLLLVGVALLLVGERVSHRAGWSSDPQPERAGPAGSAAGRGGMPDRDLAEVLRPAGPDDVELASRPLPHSLQGTEPPGGLAADENGRLLVGPGILALFDYFLSATGEEPPEVIRARIVAEIRKRLPPEAAREAIELLDRYLELRERGRELFAEKGTEEDLGARLEQVHALRREVFGDETADALFGEQEAIDYVAVAQREVARDPTLSDEEKQRRIEELDQQLPETVRLAREEALKPYRFLAEQNRLREQGAGPAEIRALREEYFGSEAADRLEALDREETAWGQRMQTYREARQRIDGDPRLAPEERARAIENLRAEHFDEHERLRVEALDRIDAAGQAVAPDPEG